VTIVGETNKTQFYCDSSIGVQM